MSKMSANTNIPETFKSFAERYPALGDAHERIAKVVDQAGPLDRK